MEIIFKTDDFVCEISHPKPKMKVIAVDEEKHMATCEWEADRKTKEKQRKDFRFDQLTYASNYVPKRF